MMMSLFINRYHKNPFYLVEQFVQIFYMDLMYVFDHHLYLLSLISQQLQSISQYQIIPVVQ